MMTAEEEHTETEITDADLLAFINDTVEQLTELGDRLEKYAETKNDRELGTEDDRHT